MESIATFFRANRASREHQGQGTASKAKLEENEKKAVYMNGHANDGSGAISLDDSNGDSAKSSGEGSGDDTEEEFQDAAETADVLHDVDETVRSASSMALSEAGVPEYANDDCPWHEELRSLVRGGLPMALRGELWQVFAGTKNRRAHGHYNALLTLLADGGGDSDGVGGLLEGTDHTNSNYLASKSGVLEKWTNQIEKDLPRTFPGHPALDEDGRDALRRLLTAYARHNPSVGYCQAMNFLAALLLLLMPEENAFWTLTGIIDDYFEGYYSEKMVEAQVDQLVFEDLVRDNFPKLISHLDNLGVQVAWVSGPWFLSIFVNVLPWESVLRVWDVLLFEGNRCMLFRTALALMEIYGPDISATRDAGDAVAFLQSMAGSTFDSSQLVMIACNGFQTVTEPRLEELRKKHRPDVLQALEERSVELSLWRSSNSSSAPKLPVLYSKGGSDGDNLLIKKAIIIPTDGFDGDPFDAAAIDAQRLGLSLKFPFKQENSTEKVVSNGNHFGPVEDEDEAAGSDIKEQVKWLKDELTRALEERKAAVVRAEELQTALVELSVQDNRRLLAATVEKLELEVRELKATLAQKEEHEASLVQVLVRMEQEQRIADDARRYAEKDAAVQREALDLLQIKFEGSATALKEMEKRAVMAESMLEATLSYQALGNNSPHGSFRRSSMDPVRAPESPVEPPLAKENVGVARQSSKGTNGTSFEEQIDSNTRKPGFFGRSFSRGWSGKWTGSGMDSPKSLDSPRSPLPNNDSKGWTPDVCGSPNEVISPETGVPSHSVCAEQASDGRNDLVLDDGTVSSRQ